MRFNLELSQSEKEVLAETIVAEEALASSLRSSVEPGNEDILVSPTTQAQIDALNGYIDSVRGSVLSPLKQAQDDIQRVIKNADDICDRAVDMINKAQRGTSQRIQLLTGARSHK